MTETQEIVDRLERLARSADSSVETTWDEIVRRAEAGPSNRVTVLPVSHKRLLAAVALAAVIAATLAVVGPFDFGSSNVSFVDRALAAASDGGPILHVVLTVPAFEQTGGASQAQTIVDLATGPATVPGDQIELYWDSSSHVLWDGANGTFRKTSLASPGSGLDSFFAGYRAALSSGRAVDEGSANVDGRDVHWLRFPPAAANESAEEVAVDAHSFRAVALRAVCPQCTQAQRVYTIATLEGVPSIPGSLKEASSSSDTVGLRDATYAVVGQSAAASVLSRPQWLGNQIDGLDLAGITSADLASYSTPTPQTGSLIATGKALTFYYGTGGAPDFQATSSPYVILAETRDHGFAFHGFNAYQTSGDGSPLGLDGRPLPADGHMLLTEGTTVWTGQLQAGGLYVEIEGTSRQLVLDAARSLSDLQ
jgi:hypothetical protein